MSFSTSWPTKGSWPIRKRSKSSSPKLAAARERSHPIIAHNGRIRRSASMGRRSETPLPTHGECACPHRHDVSRGVTRLPMRAPPARAKPFHRSAFTSRTPISSICTVRPRGAGPTATTSASAQKTAEITMTITVAVSMSRGEICRTVDDVDASAGIRRSFLFKRDA